MQATHLVPRSDFALAGQGASIHETWIHGRRGSVGGYGVMTAALAAARMRLMVGSETL